MQKNNKINKMKNKLIQLVKIIYNKLKMMKKMKCNKNEILEYKLFSF